MARAGAGRPVVGVLACGKMRANGSTYSRVNDSVVAALAAGAGVSVVLVPAVEHAVASELLVRLDGLVLPGSGSFVHPSGKPPCAEREYDEARDAVASTLLDHVGRIPDLPVLGSCRGMQEIAVHAGAELGEVVPSEVPHRLTSGPGGDRWAPAHLVEIRTGGLLAAGTAERALWVNSQHSQHVVDLPADLRVEAVAPDGVVEAISMDWPHRSVLGVQWHFEHEPDGLANRAVLAWFGDRCRRRTDSR